MTVPTDHRRWLVRGAERGYLGDLFVDPRARGTGAVDALSDALALEEGRDIVRWTAAEDNPRAHGAYDRGATRITWVTYDMTPGATSTPRSQR